MRRTLRVLDINPTWYAARFQKSAKEQAHDPSTEAGRTLHDFISRQRTAGEHIYAIIDAARDLDLVKASWFQFGKQKWWLFDRNTSPQMTDVAPYLVPLDFRSSYPHQGCGLLNMWAERLGNSVGILLISDAHQRTVWNHLNSILRVWDEAGNSFFFRYYDPRVLRVFLPTCDKKQAWEFFGPMRCIIVESETPGHLLVCTCEPSGAKIVELPLATTQESQADESRRNDGY